MIKRILSALPLAMLLIHTQAFAELYPLMEITAELYPGEVYHLGVETNADNQVSRIYYENEKLQKRFYTHGQLKEGYPIIVNDGHNVLVLQVKYDDESRNADVVFKYLYSGIWNTYRAEEMTMRFNVHIQRYELIFENRVTTSVQVTSRRLLGKVIGISSIDLK